jgi:hypothetical protein
LPAANRACPIAIPPSLPYPTNRDRQEHAPTQPIQQDLVGGQGLALLDRHGDLALAALHHVPKHRSNDLVCINPADVDFPIGFNPLSKVPPDPKPVIAAPHSPCDEAVSAIVYNCRV